MNNIEWLNGDLAPQEGFKLAPLTILKVAPKRPEHGEDEGLGEGHHQVVVEVALGAVLVLAVTVLLHTELLLIAALVILVLRTLWWPLLQVGALGTFGPDSYLYFKTFAISFVSFIVSCHKMIDHSLGHLVFHRLVYFFVDSTHHSYLALFSLSSDCCMQGNIASSRTKRVWRTWT